jgi:hypothetical protein
MKMMNLISLIPKSLTNYSRAIMIGLLIIGATGCSTLARREDAGVVIARRAQVRSSMAVVAADLIEVNRGDLVEILDSDTAENGERWLRVRTHDEENTEGWIEARNIMPEKVLDSSRKLSEEDKDIPAQATGQLRASTNLRLSPDLNNSDNILMKLESGANFEIVGWKRAPKQKNSDLTESDDAPKAGVAPQRVEKGKKESGDEKVSEETTDLWYKVRLSNSTSPAPAGWIYGKQVELTVPSDIIFYRTGREFVAWRKLDDEPEQNANAAKDKDSNKETKPSSWVILEKGSSNELHKLDEPDFDRIYVLGYDKYNQEHYTAYRSPDLKGYLPLRVDGRGHNKTFIIKIQDEDGTKKDYQYTLTKDDKSVLKVIPPNDLQKGNKKK